MTNHEIKLPFSGFYESVHDAEIDRCIENAFDYEGTGNPEIPEDFYMKMDYSHIWPEYARLYCEWLEGKINEYLETENNPLKNTFKDLTSPKYYNFETDRLFAEISDQDILRLYDMTDRKILNQVIEDRFTSRSGFSSFYHNSLENEGPDYKTTWCKPVLEWDHNQLENLLIAAILTALEKAKGWTSESKYFQEYHAFDDYGFIEDISESGRLDNIIWGNCPKECLDMVNAYDEQKRHA